MKSDSTIYWEGTMGNPGSLSYLSRHDGDTLLFISGGVDPDEEASAQHLANCWNACKGLSLPEAVEPGILAAVVSKLRDYHAAVSRQPWGEVREDGSGVVHGFRLWEETEAVLAKLGSRQAGAGLAEEFVVFASAPSLKEILPAVRAEYGYQPELR